ncbi:Protein-S-isoprenylcysteine O-methyltransferase [Mycena venus]|uniref:Protein-S-isoprenylcysteine O-methyltransferase n=1 Tax=Mycena venus TaxID=2733690 RepID=A0A8H7CI23_9AGAR|nr:Protein-S-isoprenylcysteine O-methyltransferase [Mycena venus]
MSQMPLLRIILICIQATSNHMAFTPPNRSIAKGVSRFNTDEPYLLQIAPLVAKLHQRMVWSSACLEILFYLFTLVSLPSTGSPVCLASQPNIHITPWFCIGCAAVVLGTYIRLDCFRTLKELFTFDLTIHPEHKLITDRGFYRYVRHPAYTGSLLITAGLCLSHMTKSNWATECGPLLIPGSGFIIGATWFSWTLAVGFSRVNAEDKQMRKLFPQEWDAWAANVPWWFLPGLI